MSSPSYTGQAVDESTLAVVLLGAGAGVGLRVLWRNYPEAREAFDRALSWLFTSPEVRNLLDEAAVSIRRGLADSVHRALLAG